MWNTFLPFSKDDVDGKPGSLFIELFNYISVTRMFIYLIILYLTVSQEYLFNNKVTKVPTTVIFLR